MCFENVDSDLIHQWFSDLSQSVDMYKEPLLNKKTVKFFKHICEAFSQNSHVFIMAVEVAEDYVASKRANKQEIADPVLVSITITFLCHKYEGAPECLKLKHVVDLLFHFTQKWYTCQEVTAMEIDIISELNGKWPIMTALDDLDVVIGKYMNEARLKANVRNLCVKILELVYVQKPCWFKELKDIYAQNQECMIVFQHLISSKFYIPVSILVAAIELTQYRHILDVDVILSDITTHTNIHEDHIRILANKILDMVNPQNI